MNGATVGATLATRPIGPLAVVSLFVALVAFPIAAAQAAAPAVTALAFAPDGASILAASQAGVVELAWPDLATLGRVETTLPHVHDLAFSRDGRLLAVAGGCAAESGEVELWAWPSRTLSRSVATHQDVVYDVAISDDGVTLAAASADHSISIVDIASGATRRVLEGDSRSVTAVEFLYAAGTRVVSAG